VPGCGTRRERNARVDSGAASLTKAAAVVRTESVVSRGR
jgi:hypothetical protein